ncbi:MAG: phage tail protein [Clostridia bacterium]|nr:phage tail protein [Clostridia bacterium]MBQ7504720.1 phage tail protein [Ruminococcus sp.]
MLPKLYDEFSVSGAEYAREYLGTINHCTKCQVTEVRNGAYTLSLETTVNDDCANLISSQKIIGAKPNPFDPIQYFEITKTERTTDGKIKAEATHVKNLAFQICTRGDQDYEGNIYVFHGTPTEVWNELIEDYVPLSTPFQFNTNITTAKDFSLGFSIPESLGNILGGKAGSFLDVWGGEYHWTNYTINLLSARGTTKPYQIRYGKNVSDATQTESCEDAYTHVLPYGKVSLGNRKINFYALPVAISNSESRYTKVFMLECTSFLDSYEVGQHGYLYDEVRAAMQTYAANYARVNNLGKLSVNISVTLRAELDEMAEIGLCDTVHIILDNFGTEANAKITEVVYDSLLERWDKIQIGTPKITLADLVLNKERYIH